MGSNININDALPRWSLWVRFFPLLFFITYLNFTVFLFFYGPWNYPIVDGTKLCLFLLFAHLAFISGYVTNALKKPMSYHGRWNKISVFKVCLLVNLVVLLPTASLNLGSTVPDILGAIENPGDAYFQSVELRMEKTPLINYFRMLAGPLIYLLLPLTVYYWKQISPVLRILAIICLAGIVVTFIGMGTNKAIADTVLLVPWLLLVGHLSGRLRLNRRKIILLGLVCVLAFSLFLLFFTSTQATRAGSPSSGGYFPATGAAADFDNFMIRKLPPLAQVGALGLVSYISQGYYAVYLSLEKPFVPMFGVGNSMFLFRQAARITGNEKIADMAYPMRIEENGWDGYGLWSTIYPWIASDVSFPGTILIVFLIGRLFALSWLDSLRGDNPFAVGMFAQFLIMLYYFSANNQCLQSGEGLTAFWGILSMWLLTRKIYVFTPNTTAPAMVR